MHLEPIAGMVFDCDGLLVDSDVSVLSAWSRWAVRFGLDPDVVYPQVPRQARGRYRRRPGTGAGRDRRTRAHQFEIEDAAQVSEVVGAGRLTAGLPLDRWGVVTSGTRALAKARLSAAGIAAPRVLVTADDVRRGKPEPDGYRLAAQALGLSPSDCAVVEDATSGVAAARAARVRFVIGVGRRALTTGADAVMPDLTCLGYAADQRALTISRILPPTDEP